MLTHATQTNYRHPYLGLTVKLAISRFVIRSIPRDSRRLPNHAVAPTAGVGYKLLDFPRTTLSVDGGAGAVWEKVIIKH